MKLVEQLVAKIEAEQTDYNIDENTIEEWKGIVKKYGKTIELLQDPNWDQIEGLHVDSSVKLITPVLHPQASSNLQFGLIDKLGRKYKLILGGGSLVDAIELERETNKIGEDVPSFSMIIPQEEKGDVPWSKHLVMPRKEKNKDWPTLLAFVSGQDLIVYSFVENTPPGITDPYFTMSIYKDIASPTSRMQEIKLIDLIPSVSYCGQYRESKIEIFHIKGERGIESIKTNISFIPYDPRDNLNPLGSFARFCMAAANGIAQHLPENIYSTPQIEWSTPITKKR